MGSDEMRSFIQDQLSANSKLFWDNMKLLKPKEFCDVYTRLLPFAVPKAEAAPLKENEGKLILEETKRRATIIGAGIPVKKTVEIEEEEQ